MATEVEICSAALILLGEEPIASLSEPSKRARQANSLWPLAKRDILRLHPWNCAIKRVILAPADDAPPFGWGAWFARPGDMIRLLQVGECGQTDYQFEGNRILADGRALKLVYVAELETSLWDALMTDLATKRMVRDLAYPVTRSASLKAEADQEYARAVKTAKTIDGQENPPETWGDFPFGEVRG